MMRHLMVFEDAMYAAVKGHLLGSDYHEEAGFILGNSVEHSEGKRLVISEFIPVPHEAYDERAELGLQISAVFANKVLKRARTAGKGIILCHSHPFSDEHVDFSDVDDWGEKRLLPSFTLHPEIPFAGSLVLGQRSARSRLLNREGAFESVDRVEIVGRRITLVGGETLPRGKGVEEMQSRQTLAIGPASQWMLGSVRAAVVGVGGTGSYVVDLLARLGVGELLLIDPDFLELSNVSRVANSEPVDVGNAKVAVAQEAIRRTNPHTRVRVIQGSVTTRSVGIELAGVDLAFCCTDNHSSRAVMTQMSYELGLPIIDVGTQIVVEHGKVSHISGKVVRLGPGFPCLWCADDLDPGRITEEALPPEERQRLARDGYVRGAEVKEPAVVSFNAVVAALGTGEFLEWLLPLAPGPTEHDRLLYDGLRGIVRSVRVPRRDNCQCSIALMRGNPGELPWTSRS